MDIQPYLRTRQCQVEWYHCLESTNKTAREKANNGALHGTVIIANSQTAGKGKFGKNFFSPAGLGLYMSLILLPQQMNLDPLLTTIYAGVSVCQAIEELTELVPGIKWANDILINGRKICGILTETGVAAKNRSRWIVLGIGVNISIPEEAFPQEIQNRAASLFLSGVPSPETKERLAAGIIDRILSSEAPASGEIIGQYKQRLVMLGQMITVTGMGEPYNALAVDVDKSGGLVIRKNNGSMSVLSSGEIFEFK
ncbi:MAG: biotin--[acetyl-CoA-carboxylase] ligase [Oscillospiraceae bacterium]|nr:biotin--[acetyl-CoA-carboxylase] ligase [Oscillospiraceae bacterium]